jgi:hypothetical protein
MLQIVVRHDSPTHDLAASDPMLIEVEAAPRVILSTHRDVAAATTIADPPPATVTSTASPRSPLRPSGRHPPSPSSTPCHRSLTANEVDALPGFGPTDRVVGAFAHEPADGSSGDIPTPKSPGAKRLEQFVGEIQKHAT